MSDRKVRFDCVGCGKRYAVPATSAGAMFTCPCGRTTRVPKRSTVGDGSGSPLDWLVGRFVYGLGGAFFGLIFGFLFLRWAAAGRFNGLLVGAAAGFVLGFVAGEPFINAVGGFFRDREDSRG